MKALTLCLLVTLPAVSTATPPDYSVIPLTEDVWAGRPDIDGGRIVWSDIELGDREIRMRYGRQVINLSERPGPDYLPRVSGNRVVWYGFDGHDHEIFFHDGNTVRQLTDNDREDIFPSISGRQVAWIQHDGLDYDVFLMDTSTGSVTRITDNDVVDSPPDIDAGRVVWRSKLSGNPEIFLYDNGEVRQLTDLGVEKFNPRISGNRVVFSGMGPVWLWEDGVVTEIGEPGTIGRAPDIDGDRVVWTGGEPFGEVDVFVYDGATRTRIDDGGATPNVASISGRTIVFVGARSGSRIPDVFVALPFRIVWAGGE